MDTGKAIFFGSLMIALAITVAAVIPAPERYIGVSSDFYSIGIVDTQTGAVRRCQYEKLCTEWLK